jgi:hypothetical protein
MRRSVPLHHQTDDDAEAEAMAVVQRTRRIGGSILAAQPSGDENLQHGRSYLIPGGSWITESAPDTAGPPPARTTNKKKKRKKKKIDENVSQIPEILSATLSEAVDAKDEVTAEYISSPRGASSIATIRGDWPTLLALAHQLEKLARDEIAKLASERPNDPFHIQRNKAQNELLEILADGFARISAALSAVIENPDQPILLGKASAVVNAVGLQLGEWLSTNATDATDWTLRGSFMVAVLAALGWAGADMSWATPGILALVGGEKVARVIAHRKKDRRKSR